MRQISRYLLRQLLVTTAIVTLVMTGVIWLFVSVRAVETIVNRGLSVSTFVELTALQMPNFISQIIPIALFIAVLFVYNRLTTDREILVLRAAGLSPLALARPMLVLAGAMVVIGYIFTLWATPLSYRMFRDLQWDLRYSFTNVLLREGTFNTLSDSITVYVRERTGRDELKGLLIYDKRDKDKTATIIAERGAVVDAPTGARVLMFDGNRQEYNAKTDKLSVLYFDRYSFDLSGANQKPDTRHREARERGVEELFTLTPEDAGNPIDYGRFTVEAHQRVTSPLNALGFSLVAFIFIVYGEFSRRGQTSRIINAASIFVALQVIGLGLTNFLARHLGLVPLIYAATLLPIAIPLFILIYNPTVRMPGIRRGTAERTA
jgi:lipopolysaccharide export system permease protein